MAAALGHLAGSGALHVQQLPASSLQRCRPTTPGSNLQPGLRAGTASSGGGVSVGGTRHVRRSVAARPLSGSDLANSPLPVMAASPVAANRSAAPLHAASSSGSGDSYGGGFSPSSSNPPSSSSDSSSSPNGAASPPLDPRSSANTSELLRAVLKRRAERLQRQQDPTTSAYLPAAPPEQQQQQQAEPSAQQQQQSQQQPPLQQAPPRYKPHWNSSGPDGSAPVNGAATHLNRAAAAAAAHLNGAAAGPYGGSAAAPLNGAYNGAYNGAAAAPAAPPPPAPPSPASLPPVPAPEQRVVRAAAAAAVREDAISQRKLATVRFWLKFKAEWGQRLKVVGSHQELGGWLLAAAPELKWSQGDNWHTTVQLPAGGVVEYKYVLLDHSGNHPVAWQQGNNSVLALRPGDELVEVFDNWGANPGAKLVADGGSPVTREHRLLSWASEMEAQLVSQKQDLRRSRMELAAAQEEAREARIEAQRYKAQLLALEADKAEAANHLQQARALNSALQSQLADTTASFQEALRTAADILSQIDEVSTSDALGAAGAAAPAALAGAASQVAPAARQAPTSTELAATGGEVDGALEEARKAAAALEAAAAASAGAAVEEASAASDEELSEEESSGGEEEAAASGPSLEGEAAALGFAPHPAAATGPAGAGRAPVPFVASTKRRRRPKGTKTKGMRK